jgi:hypothetical protein
MEEKTEHLRDIFMEVADEKTVTETQAEQRGSLIRSGSVDDRLADVIEQMRDRFGFETNLETERLCAVVRQFYDGDPDGEIADALGISPAAVFDARMDLHLVRDDETTGVDHAALRECLDDGMSDAEIAAALDGDPDQVTRARRVVETERQIRRVSHRFQTEFEEVLTDADVAVQFTAEMQEDGLDEAAEDIETDVDF